MNTALETFARTLSSHGHTPVIHGDATEFIAADSARFSDTFTDPESGETIRAAWTVDVEFDTLAQAVAAMTDMRAESYDSALLAFGTRAHPVVTLTLESTVLVQFTAA